MFISSAAHLSPSAIFAQMLSVFLRIPCFTFFHRWELQKRKNAATIRSASRDPAKKKKKKLMVREQHMEGRDSGIACLGKQGQKRTAETKRHMELLNLTTVFI